MYHRCPGCKTIFTPDNIDHLVVTENDAITHRNNSLRFEEVLMRTGSGDAEQGPFIDFGCGNGAFVDYMNRTGLDAMGIDKDTSCQLVDLNKDLYGGAFMIESIEHLSNPIETVLEIGTKLRPFGFLYIESTFAESIADHTDHPYVSPKIGHRTILSRQALIAATAEVFDAKVLNSNVVILRKK